jgi:hypothetical protein
MGKFGVYTVLLAVVLSGCTELKMSACKKNCPLGMHGYSVKEDTCVCMTPTDLFVKVQAQASPRPAAKAGKK